MKQTSFTIHLEARLIKPLLSGLSLINRNLMYICMIDFLIFVFYLSLFNLILQENPEHPVSRVISDSYLTEMAKDSTWADHPTIQSLAEMMKLNIKIFTSLESRNINQIDGRGDWNSPILLGYIFNSHYMSLVPSK